MRVSRWWAAVWAARSQHRYCRDDKGDRKPYIAHTLP